MPRGIAASTVTSNRKSLTGRISPLNQKSQSARKGREMIVAIATRGNHTPSSGAGWVAAALPVGACGLAGACRFNRFALTAAVPDQINVTNIVNPEQLTGGGF